MHLSMYASDVRIEGYHDAHVSPPHPLEGVNLRVWTCHRVHVRVERAHVSVAGLAESGKQASRGREIEKNKKSYNEEGEIWTSVRFVAWMRAIH